MSQCVSCNNQPNDNDSLGGGTHEGAVTPMVVGIIAGTVAVFVLVLCALFYCAKLENDKARRGLKADAAVDDDNLAAAGDYPPGRPPQQRQQQQQQQQGTTAPPLDEDEGVGILDGDDDGCGSRRQHHRRPEEGSAAAGKAERRPSSVTVVAVGEADDSRCPAGAGANGSWVPAGVVGGRKKGLFGWGGGKKSSGRATPADNPPVTAIEMV